MTKIYGAAIVVLAALAAACTEVDDRLGQSMLPTNQRMKIAIETFTNSPTTRIVETRLYRTDSVPSSRLGVGFLGRMSDAGSSLNVFGAQTSSMVMQFKPYSVPYSGKEGYGIDPIIDSMRIMLAVNDARGDTLKTQTFEVWDLKIDPPKAPRLHRDSVYFNNFPVDDYKNQKLFTFSHRGKGNVKARLIPTDAGRKYMDSLVYIKEWKVYTDDGDLFYEKFHGLWITPEAASDPAAAVYSFDPGTSFLELNVRNHDQYDRQAVKDTVKATFLFRDADYQYQEGYATKTQKWNNVSVNITSFDYTGSVLGGIKDATNDFKTPTPQKLVYIQPMSGVGTSLHFSDDFVGKLRALSIENGKDRYDIMINSAMMHLWLDGDVSDHHLLDGSIGRLGAYSNLTKLKGTADYQYLVEASRRAQQGGESYRLPFGGFLNRSLGYYELDVTAQIQALVTNKETSESDRQALKTMTLAPDVFGLYSFGRSVMRGYDPASTEAQDRPISIRLTYTKIAK